MPKAEPTCHCCNAGDGIFVFGSNLAGRHGKGAAKHAWEWHSARYGQGIGMQGGSYAIPTKGHDMAVLPLATIRWHVDAFLKHASAYPKITFWVTAIGTGLAGYRHEQIAPMFKDAPPNCRLPEEWKGLIES